MNRTNKLAHHSHTGIVCPVRFRRGFTLVELMVVIAIMALLSAILLPALSKGRSRSHAIGCLNNLRQLQLCWQMYPDDNNGELPANNYVNGFKINRLTDIKGDSWCPGDAINDATTDNIKRGLLYSYSKSTAIYRCPADYSRVQAPAAGEILRTRSYKMSGSINCTVSGSPTYRKVTEIAAPQDPGRLFVFTDAHESSVVDAHFTVEFDSKQWVDMPSSRHDRAGNLSFADGHVERWRWKTDKNFLGWKQKFTAEELEYDVPRLKDAMHQQ